MKDPGCIWHHRWTANDAIQPQSRALTVFCLVYLLLKTSRGVHVLSMEGDQKTIGSERVGRWMADLVWGPPVLSNKARDAISPLLDGSMAHEIWRADTG